MKILKNVLTLLAILFITIPSLKAESDSDEIASFKETKGVVTSTIQIKLKEYPTAYNPSIIKHGKGYLLTFRHQPDIKNKPWISHIGIVQLDQAFQPISKPHLLKVCKSNSPIPSQAEDARIFSYMGKTYVIYNDNREVISPLMTQRRDMYLAELKYDGKTFKLLPPLKLVHPEKYNTVMWEKNWTPFVSGDMLLLSYHINPHEVLCPNLISGECLGISTSSSTVQWKWGKLRGGTPALLVDGEYLAFFHSGKEMASEASFSEPMWHYFMGAYTFSASAPFKMTKASPEPITEKSFYTQSKNPKRVIYPGGFVVSKNTIYLAYGKDDAEMWIAVINKSNLMKTLRSVK